MIQNEAVIVQFEKPLRSVAQKVKEIYPSIKSELEHTFQWKLDFKPAVVIIKDGLAFQRMAGSKLTLAYALPQKKQIVIDYSKMHTHPFTLKVILKHELSHLLLHHHIGENNLPKWLDEGIAQWVSGGIGEILMGGGKEALLNRASLSGTLIGMGELSKTFPKDEKSLLLAYEETKSFVEYIVGEFGISGIRQILKYLKDGDAINVATFKGFSIAVDDLERDWHNDLKKRMTWVPYLANNLYLILFSFAALITIIGFIKFLVKKRKYKDDDEEMMDEYFP